MQVLDRHGAGTDTRVSVTTNEPTGLMSASSATSIGRDASSSSFEETDFVIAGESNIAVYKTLVMALCGGLAVLGIVTSAVHLVVGAMLIAPSFEPLVRVSLGISVRAGPGDGGWRTRPGVRRAGRRRRSDCVAAARGRHSVR
jgi:hypothetical protein